MDDHEKAELSGDEAREERINMEIVVDAYGEDERALGWYYYLEGHLGFPSRARCIEERLTSPLRTGDTVEVVAMAPQEECEQEMFVQIKWEERDLAVPLAQLEGVRVDKETKQAIEDWHYWVRQGYEF